MFRTIIIKAIFDLIDKFLVSKISYIPLQSFVQAQLQPVQQVADLLTDENPDNNEQLKTFWDNNRANFVNVGLDTAILIIRQEVKDQAVADNIIAILESIDIEQKQRIAA